jgi:hypothetical protein
MTTAAGRDKPACAFFVPAPVAGEQSDPKVNQVCRVVAEYDYGKVLVRLGDGREAAIDEGCLLLIDREKRRTQLKKLSGSPLKGELEGVPVRLRSGEADAVTVIANAYRLDTQGHVDALIDRVLDYEFGEFQTSAV